MDGYKVILTNTKPELNSRLETMYRTIELENQSPVVDTMHLIFDPSDDDSSLIESDDDKPPFDDGYVSEDVDEENDDSFDEENVYSGPPQKIAFIHRRSTLNGEVKRILHSIVEDALDMTTNVDLFR